MNIENMKTLRTLLVHLRETNRSDKFVMDEYMTDAEYRHCKTAACLAGWACILKNEFSPGTVFSEEEAREWLGLSKGDGNRMFLGQWSRKSLENITLDDAVAYLDRCIRVRGVVEN